MKVGGNEFLHPVQRLVPLEIADERLEVESSAITDSTLKKSTASAQPMAEICATRLGRLVKPVMSGPLKTAIMFWWRVCD